MYLYLLRHAQPSTSDESSQLSQIGESQARQVQVLFSQLRLDIQKITVLSTTSPRAQQTAEIIGRGLELCSDRVIQIPNAIASGEPFLSAHLLYHIRKPVKEGRDVVIFVGHAPFFPLLIDFLTGSLQSDLNPSHCSVVSLEGDSESQGDWKQFWWISPMPTTFLPSSQPPVA